MRKEDKACAVIFDEMSLKDALNNDHSKTALLAWRMLVMCYQIPIL